MTAIPITAPIRLGALASMLLLTAYLGFLATLSGWAPALSQFLEFWRYIVALALGFGIQVALYLRLRQVVARSRDTRAVVTASGTTSGAAMISCCLHYVANVAPVLGATGLVTLAAQYQIELFWLGLAFNAAGIAYIGSKLFNATREHAQCIAA
jgi:Cu+-exporting ATPase